MKTYTVSEVAKMLGIKPAAVYSRIYVWASREPKIFVLENGHYRITDEQFEKYWCVDRTKFAIEMGFSPSRKVTKIK